jgi:small subunit ribosomal protein S21
MEYKKYKKPNKKHSNEADLEGGDTTGNPKFAHIQPIQAKHLEVKVYDNFDRALRAFRTLVQKERILSTYKEKQSYEKPSDKKRRKRAEMKRKMLELEHKRPENTEKTKKRKYREEAGE